MQVHVNTDNHIQGSEQMTQEVVAELEGALSRFADRITRVEVHFSDESSSSKSREGDKRCGLVARLMGLQPLAVSHDAGSLTEALDGAAAKLEKLLERTLGQREDPKGRPSFSG